jgi:hypothetical protein
LKTAFCKKEFSDTFMYVLCEIAHTVTIYTQIRQKKEGSIYEDVSDVIPAGYGHAAVCQHGWDVEISDRQTAGGPGKGLG